MKGSHMAGLRLSLASRVRGQHCRWALQRRQQSSVARTGDFGASGVAALDRGIIRLDGPDTLPFLQGLTTNDTTLLENDQTQCQYTSVLHPKGATRSCRLRSLHVWLTSSYLLGCAARRPRAVGDVRVVASRYGAARLRP
jgi:hypothetical protein